MKITKIGLALLLAAVLALPGWAAENTVTIEETVHRVESIPGDWNPLTAAAEQQRFLLEQTGDRLYRLAGDGSVVPSLAAGLPVDVTAEHAGNEAYGIPSDAHRGYAFTIDLNPDAKWQDGTPITAEDYLFTLETMVKNGKELPLANLEAYRAGKCRDSQDIVSLEDAGYASAADARAAGLTSFYLDTEGFWGLSAGWQSISSRTRIRDNAMRSGLDEFFVSPAYLYAYYLADGTDYSRWQGEFLGIPTASDEVYTIEDVGFVQTGERQITLILAQPTTPVALALILEDIYVLNQSLWGEAYATSMSSYSACGPYRIASMGAEEILLVANEHWHGEAPKTDAVYIRPVA